MPSIAPQRSQMKPKKLSVSEYNNQRKFGGGMSVITDPKTGQRLSTEAAEARGPFYMPGFNTNFGQGGRGNSRGGGEGFQGGRGGFGRIGSAAGALGSKGIPTSQRGRFEKFGPEAAEMTTSEVSGLLNNGFGGLDEFDRMNSGRDGYRTGAQSTEGSGFIASSLPFRDEGGVQPPQQIRTPEIMQAEDDRKKKELELLALQQAPSLFNMGQFAPRMGFKPQIFR